MRKTKWHKVGLLNRNVVFKATKKINPINTLLDTIKEMLPQARDVSDVAVTHKTNSYLKKQIIKHLKKNYPFIGETTLEADAAWIMFAYSPTDLQEGEDFVVYTTSNVLRRKAKKGKKNA